MIKDTNKRMIVTIDKRTYKKLEELAASDNRSVSNYVVTIIKEHLKTKGK